MNDTDLLRAILGARDGETLYDAATRVADERASLQKFKEAVAATCGVITDERDDDEYLLNCVSLTFDSYQAMKAVVEEKIVDLAVAERECETLRAELADAGRRQEETQYWLDEFQGKVAKQSIELLERPSRTELLAELIDCCKTAAENDRDTSAFWPMRCLQRALEARISPDQGVKP